MHCIFSETHTDPRTWAPNFKAGQPVVQCGLCSKVLEWPVTLMGTIFNIQIQIPHPQFPGVQILDFSARPLLLFLHGCAQAYVCTHRFCMCNQVSQLQIPQMQLRKAHWKFSSKFAWRRVVLTSDFPSFSWVCATTWHHQNRVSVFTNIRRLQRERNRSNTDAADMPNSSDTEVAVTFFIKHPHWRTLLLAKIQTFSSKMCCFSTTNLRN